MGRGGENKKRGESKRGGKVKRERGKEEREIGKRERKGQRKTQIWTEIQTAFLCVFLSRGDEYYSSFNS